MIALETVRLSIRNFRAGDWKALQEMIIQYKSSKYAAYDHQWPTSTEKIKEIAEWFASGDSYLAVCLKDQLIGLVSLTQGADEGLQEYNLGYVFNFDYHRKGYASEACRAAVDYAFDRLQARRVIAGTAAVNVASCRLLEGLGFRRVGESTCSFKKTDEGNPIEFTGVSFSLSRDEWMSSNKRK